MIFSERMSLGTLVHSRVEELLKARSEREQISEQDLLDIVNFQFPVGNPIFPY